MVKIRLRRMGAKKNPFYRIVVADSKSPRDGRCIEELGTYDPLTKPSTIVLDTERAEYWIKNGAQPTDTVRALIKKAQAGPQAPVAEEKPAEEKPAKEKPAKAAKEKVAKEEAVSEEPAAEEAPKEEAVAEEAPQE